MAKHPAPGYLFFGTRGNSKRQLAEIFIRAILEHPEASSLNTHPDFAFLQRPEDSEIYPVEAVREFLQFLHSSSAHGTWRVALIDEAERLSTASVNALLKDVEESKRVVFVFITDRLEQMPATLQSRLVHIPCEPTLQDRQEENEQTKQEQGFAKELIQGFQSEKIGETLAIIDRIAKICEANPDKQKIWQIILTQGMKQVFIDSTISTLQQDKIGQAFIRAWNLLGTSLSPRVGLEYELVKREFTGEVPEIL